MIINEVAEEWSMHSHTHALHCLQISRSALHHLHAALQPFVLNWGYCQFQRHHTSTESLTKPNKMGSENKFLKNNLKRASFNTDFPP